MTLMARIFVVEDNDSLREAVCSYLRLNDHDIEEFPRIGAVLEAIATKPPDLIVLDVMLPDGDGFLLARKIRGSHDVPIVFLTAKASESDRITGFELGADDYVVKPFSPKELSLRVEAVPRNAGSTLFDVLITYGPPPGSSFQGEPSVPLDPTEQPAHRLQHG